MGRPRKVKPLEDQGNAQLLEPPPMREVVALPDLLEIVGIEPVLSQGDIARVQSRLFSGVVRRALEVTEANKLVWLLEQLGKTIERHSNQRAMEAKNSEAFTGIMFVPARVLTDEDETAHVDALIVNGGNGQ